MDKYFESFSSDLFADPVSLTLATTFGIAAAIIMKFASSLRLNLSYLNFQIEGNFSYLIGFTITSGITFLIFKFNKFLDIQVLEHPLVLIEKTPIGWYGLGGILMGLAYGLGLLYNPIYKLTSLREVLRLAVFAVTSRIVYELRQPYGDTEGLTFLEDFDYKFYNMVVIIIAGILIIFTSWKQLFIGIILGAVLLFSHAFQKDSINSLPFLAFLIIFNLINGIIDPKKKSKILLKESLKPVVETPDQQSSSSKEAQPESVKTNSEIFKDKTKVLKAVSNKKKAVVKPKAKTEESSFRLVISSVIGGIGYGICGVLPEHALLHVAVFTPHVTLVYTISFIVGCIFMIAVLSILEYDEEAGMRQIVLDEYKAHKQQIDKQEAGKFMPQIPDTNRATHGVFR